MEIFGFKNKSSLMFTFIRELVGVVELGFLFHLTETERFRDALSSFFKFFEMKGFRLEFEKPIADAISRIRFSPHSNNLLISSWDSCLRLYDVDGSHLRLESPGEPPLLDCCFQNDAIVFTAASDGFIRRYDLHLGTNDSVGNHDDIATCLQFSEETSQLVTAGLDKKIMFWDTCTGKASGNLDADVASLSLSGYDLIVAVGASVNMYDLRNLGRSVQSSESRMDVQIKCVSSIPYSRGHVVGSVDGRVAVEISHPSDSNNPGYTFRCYPKSKDGRHHLVPVNDVVFSPLACGAFVTGDNEGYVAAWDSQSRRRLFELPRFSNSVASLSYNHRGQLLAVASSYTYQEASAIEEPPQIFIIRTDDFQQRSACVGSSSRH